MTDTTGMDITLGAEFALNLHVDAVLTYTAIEEALTSAGITSYAILRWVNPDDSCDVQITVRNNTQGELLDAGEALENLSGAINALLATDPEPEPSENG